MINDDDMSVSLKPDNTITLGEDLGNLSLDDLAARRAALEDEIRRTDDAAVKKRAGRDAADAVFKI